METVRSEAFAAWLPVQQRAAEWFGDTRFVAADRRFVSDEQIEALPGRLQPGDILVERRNWYLSNVGLPGFWPHAALYVGTEEEIGEYLNEDPEVVDRYGLFTEHLKANYPEAWTFYAEELDHGDPHRLIEAVGEGVIATSIEHSAAADYVGALRPLVPPVIVARALDRAFAFWGRPYDFDFDFATDDAIVCSELVVKAFEPESPDDQGLRIEPVEIVGRRTVPPTELVRLFAAELESESPQLEFVLFLDGREGEDVAIEGTQTSLAESASRPKWDVLQP